jgi:hypothetical protein
LCCRLVGMLWHGLIQTLKYPGRAGPRCHPLIAGARLSRVSWNLGGGPRLTPPVG